MPAPGILTSAASAERVGMVDREPWVASAARARGSPAARAVALVGTEVEEDRVEEVREDPADRAGASFASAYRVRPSRAQRSHRAPAAPEGSAGWRAGPARPRVRDLTVPLPRWAPEAHGRAQTTRRPPPQSCSTAARCRP